MTPPRVLLADDHPRFLAAIGRLLAQDDCEIVGSVEDGARLLEEAARLQPDVIVLDLFMPVMDGLKACRELTRMLARTKIIVLTAEVDDIIKQVLLAAGAFAFIDKREISTDLLPAVKLSLVKKHFGDVPLSAITATAIAEFQCTRHDAGIANRTINMLAH
jgi:DNA-binding NarL/FixJ family response regulator